MTDDENEYTRSVLMDTEPLTAVVKEDGNGVPFLALEPGFIFLKFRRPTTIEEADKAAKWLRETFDISTPAPCQPPPSQGTPEDFGQLTNDLLSFCGKHPRQQPGWQRLSWSHVGLGSDADWDCWRVGQGRQADRATSVLRVFAVRGVSENGADAAA